MIKAFIARTCGPSCTSPGTLPVMMESPVYAILKMSDAINKIQLPEGYHVKQYSGTTLPDSTERFSMKWDGEWHITVEVFRDLGLAFAAVLVLIYVLVVGWFKSFKTPLVIMAPIPLTLVGILPAHALMGAFFTATSMIGFIAGAGIIVRNSIILVDFIELRRSHGMSLEEAVVDAGAVRFRPMLLTAAAVVVGASVILFDPIFQGLAISLMAGEVASTVLSRMTVPVLYYLSERGGTKNSATRRRRSRARGRLKRRQHHDCRPLPQTHRRGFRPGFPRIGILGEPVLVSLHSFRGLEPFPVSLYELVPDDDNPSQSRCEGIVGEP